MLIDWIIRQTVKQGQNGIQWAYTKQLDHLDFTYGNDMEPHMLKGTKAVGLDQISSEALKGGGDTIVDRSKEVETDQNTGLLVW